jgi:hypothetical protein
MVINEQTMNLFNSDILKDLKDFDPINMHASSM